MAVVSTADRRRWMDPVASAHGEGARAALPVGEPVAADLADKTVFLSGPRQVGKTTLALRLIGATDARHPAYLSLDDARTRAHIRKAEMPAGEPRIVLDEVHKYAPWRDLVKGLWDRCEPAPSFLVTGSARLEVYRRGGDSLQGR